MKKITLFVTTVISLGVQAQTPDIDLINFSSGYVLPVDITNCGDNRLFVAEQGGKIWICKSDGTKGNTFLNITKKVYNEPYVKGLMGFTFHPDYANNGYFYVYYLNKQKNTVISRFSVSLTNPNKASPSSEKVIITIKQTYGGNHFGGCIKFGPDGYLYIGMGDGDNEGDANNTSQAPNLFLGKMLRIDVDHGTTYAIPPDNPFKNTPGYKKEIWALGLRNPWRWSFDQVTGDLWLPDVGADSLEEINYQLNGDAGGENYGWRCYQGFAEYNTTGCGPVNDYTFPIVEYSHAGSDCAIIGGYVYRGSSYPNIIGKYIYCDYCSGKFRMIYNDGSWHNDLLTEFAGHTYVSFGEDVNDELYVISYDDGNIYHLVDQSSPSPKSEFKISGADSKCMIYPNPSDGNFAINLNSSRDEEINVSVYDITGKEINDFTEQVRKGLNQFQINNHMISGEYIVVIHSSDFVTTRKLFVE